MVKEIQKIQQELILLAETKDTLTDPELYEKSCLVDKMIVKFMKEYGSKNLKSY